MTRAVIKGNKVYSELFINRGNMMLYRSLVKEFNSIALQEESRLTRRQMDQATNRLSAKNSNVPQFDIEVADQLWQHTTKTPQGKVKVKDYVQTVMDAHYVLRQHIEQGEEQLGQNPKAATRAQIQQALVSYRQDHEILSRTFNLNSVPLGDFSAAPSDQSRFRNRSHVYEGSADQNNFSLSLTVVFYMCVGAFLLQILCMYTRDHFLNILTYLALLSLFFMNYFDKTYVRFVLVLLGVSLAFDVAWCILYFKHIWHHEPGQSQHSHKGDGFRKFVYIMTIILMVVKTVMLILLMRFRNNLPTVHKNIQLFTQRLNLSGKNINNPVTSILSPKDPYPSELGPDNNQSQIYQE